MIETKFRNIKNIYVLCANSCGLDELKNNKYINNVYKTKDSVVQENYDLYKVDNTKRKNLCN